MATALPLRVQVTDQRMNLAPLQFEGDLIAFQTVQRVRALHAGDETPESSLEGIIFGIVVTEHGNIIPRRLSQLKAI